MTYHGTVHRGVVELDESGASLPDGTRVRVEPMTATEESAPSPNGRDARGWPEGFFEHTFGSIADDTFARPLQGELPEAIDLE